MRETANGSRVEALIESWGTAREKGESGQQDIKRRSTSDSGNQWRSSFLPGGNEPAMRQVHCLFLTSPAVTHAWL